jgi:hypothetical protein
MKVSNKNKNLAEGLKTPPEGFVPLEKQSKKAQREYHAHQRRTWGPLNPVTRKPPNSRAYKRAAAKKQNLDD